MIPFEPLVSIIIPVYNGADYLGQAVRSALAQTYARNEILIVNDGSTDDGATARIARSFGDAVRYIEKPNGGVASALNKGIAEMRGDYFSWLSHDDIYSPIKLSQQIEVMRQVENSDLIQFCNTVTVDERSRIIGEPERPRELLENTVLAVLGTQVNGCTLLVPRSAFQKVGTFDERLKTVQDNDLWLRMAMAGIPFAYQPHRLVFSRSHAKQCSRTMRDHHYKEKELFYIKAVTKLGKAVSSIAPQLRDILKQKKLPKALAYLDGFIPANGIKPRE